MQLRVFSIFDSKVGAYAQPFYSRTTAEAIRSVTEALNDPQSTLSKYPHDFILFDLATYDDQTGQFSSNAAPMSLGVLSEFKPQPQPQTAPLFQNNPDYHYDPEYSQRVSRLPVGTKTPE